MADIKLGLSGSEVTLPPCQARGGVPPGMPVGYIKQIDRTTMADGSTRYNSKAYHPRTFSLSWEQLPVADITALQTLANHNVRLHYLNEWISAAWSWVRVANFRFTPVVYLGTILFSASMEFEEEL